MKQQMKKIRFLALALAAILCVGALAGCTSNSSDDDSSGTTNDTPANDTTNDTTDSSTADDTADTYTIPTTEGVQYLVDGAVVAAGTVSVGDIDATVAVTAEALEGYVLEGTASWTLAFTKVPAPTPVTATAPTFDDVADTYRIPQKAGVQYLVDGVPTAAKTVMEVLRARRLMASRLSARDTGRVISGRGRGP